jgi:hypothetical protein
MTAPEGKATSPEESEMHSSAARREVNATCVWKNRKIKIRENKLSALGACAHMDKKKTNGKSEWWCCLGLGKLGAAVLRPYNDSPVRFMLYARGRRLT